MYHQSVASVVSKGSTVQYICNQTRGNDFSLQKSYAKYNPILGLRYGGQFKREIVCLTGLCVAKIGYILSQPGYHNYIIDFRA